MAEDDLLSLTLVDWANQCHLKPSSREALRFLTKGTQLYHLYSAYYHIANATVEYTQQSLLKTLPLLVDQNEILLIAKSLHLLLLSEPMKAMATCIQRVEVTFSVVSYDFFEWGRRHEFNFPKALRTAVQQFISQTYGVRDIAIIDFAFVCYEKRRDISSYAGEVMKENAAALHEKESVEEWIAIGSSSYAANMRYRASLVHWYVNLNFDSQESTTSWAKRRRMNADSSSSWLVPEQIDQLQADAAYWWSKFELFSNNVNNSVQMDVDCKSENHQLPLETHGETSRTVIIVQNEDALKNALATPSLAPLSDELIALLTQQGLGIDPATQVVLLTCLRVKSIEHFKSVSKQHLEQAMIEAKLKVVPRKKLIKIWEHLNGYNLVTVPVVNRQVQPSDEEEGSFNPEQRLTIAALTQQRNVENTYLAFINDCLTDYAPKFTPKAIEILMLSKTDHQDRFKCLGRYLLTLASRTGATIATQEKQIEVTTFTRKQPMSKQKIRFDMSKIA